MALELKTPPATEPLTVDEAKSYLKVTDTAEDAWVAGAIQAVRERCEAFCRRALITQTWVWWLDAFPRACVSDFLSGVYELPVTHFDAPGRELNIPRPPLQSVTHLKTYGADDSAAVFDSAKYLVDTASEPGRIVLRQNQAWPTGLRTARGIEVEYVAGYGQAADVPQALRQGMLLWVRLLYADKTWLFESGSEVPGLSGFNQEDMPLPVRALWDPFRLVRV